MAGFTEAALVKKLVSDLNSTQDSIQTLSLWLIHHRRHSAVTTQIWLRELMKAPTNRKLTFLYLANDVVQNSKKRGPEYTADFAKVMPQALRSLKNIELDEKTVGSITRLLKIWKERSIFESKLTDSLIAAWRPVSSNGAGTSASAAKTPAPSQNGRSSGTSSPSAASPVKKIKISTPAKVIKTPEDEGSPCEPDGTTAPTPAALLDMFQALEKSASADAVVREKIAKFPPEISDPAFLSKVTDKNQAFSLRNTIEDAVTILVEYNARLDVEMEQRKDLRQMLVNFIHAMKEKQEMLDKTFNDRSSLLDKASRLDDEMQAHFQSLPDLSKEARKDARLPDPSDLFR